MEIVKSKSKRYEQIANIKQEIHDKELEESIYLFQKMKDYLQNIRKRNETKSKNKYKMITISPLRYAGGKSRAIGYILEVFPKINTNKIISPFFGGGSFEFVLSSKIGYNIIGYDVFDILVNYWYYQINYPKKLYNELKKLVPDKENFTKYRHILLHYWEKVKPKDLNYKTRNLIPLTEEEKTRLDNNPLKLAAYYYYNHQLSYGPMFLGWPSSIYLKRDRYKKIIEKVRDFKPGNVVVKADSFENVLEKHKRDFLFCDPPYYLDGDSKMFKGIYPNSNFAIHHKNFDHKLLKDLLLEHKGGFILTYNNCSAIRNYYSDYDQYFPSWQYSYGQGETRIGKNRINNGTFHNIKESHEIIIVKKPNH